MTGAPKAEQDGRLSHMAGCGQAAGCGIYSCNVEVSLADALGLSSQAGFERHGLSKGGQCSYLWAHKFISRR